MKYEILDWIMEQTKAITRKIGKIPIKTAV